MLHCFVSTPWRLCSSKDSWLSSTPDETWGSSKTTAKLSHSTFFLPIHLRSPSFRHPQSAPLLHQFCQSTCPGTHHLALFISSGDGFSNGSPEAHLLSVFPNPSRSMQQVKARSGALIDTDVVSRLFLLLIPFVMNFRLIKISCLRLKTRWWIGEEMTWCGDDNGAGGCKRRATSKGRSHDHIAREDQSEGEWQSERWHGEFGYPFSSSLLHIRKEHTYCHTHHQRLLLTLNHMFYGV